LEAVRTGGEIPAGQQAKNTYRAGNGFLANSCKSTIGNPRHRNKAKNCCYFVFVDEAARSLLEAMRAQPSGVAKPAPTKEDRMTIVVKGFKSAASLATAIWLAGAVGASAADTDIGDLPGTDQASVHSFPGCPATAAKLKLRLLPLTTRLRVRESSGVALPAFLPVPLRTNSTRVPYPLVIGVAY
jgi:hypothetical protein